MELNEFTEKFLPDYEAKISDYHKSYWRDNPIGWENEGKRRFNMGYFPEALQAFSDRLCQKQRENCANKIRKMVTAAIETMSSFTDAKVWITTYNAEQPKIEEL